MLTRKEDPKFMRRGVTIVRNQSQTPDVTSVSMKKGTRLDKPRSHMEIPSMYCMEVEELGK